MGDAGQEHFRCPRSVPPLPQVSGVSRGLRQFIRYDEGYEYYTLPDHYENIRGYLIEKYGRPEAMHEVAYNWYDSKGKIDVPEAVIRAAEEKYGHKQVDQHVTPTGQEGDCNCKLTCSADAMFGGRCNRKVDQEDGLCTPCRGYKIMMSGGGPRKIHCHGCNEGMSFGHYSEARAAEDIWSPKRTGEGEPDSY